MSDLAKTTELLQSRRGGDIPPATAEFMVTYTRLLAQGKPVSAQAEAAAHSRSLRRAWR